MYWYFLTFSYKLTVSNGLSLMVWKHVAVTFSSSSFKWGRTSPVTFLSIDCFEWVLIDGMEMRSCHFFIKQLQMVGGHWTKLVHQPDLNLETVTTALHCLQLYLLYSFICSHLVLSCWTGQSYIYYFRIFLSIYSCCCAFDCILLLLLLLCITEQQLDVISYVKLPFLTTKCQ